MIEFFISHFLSSPSCNNVLLKCSRQILSSSKKNVAFDSVHFVYKKSKLGLRVFKNDKKEPPLRFPPLIVYY